MRLVNAENYEFEEFDNEFNTPKYAILSHRWEEDEVTYQDAVNIGLQHLNKKGIKKIEQCRQKTLAFDLRYFWVDTCCIDKTSSAELSEAINSMFRWYQRAEVCFAYLADIAEQNAIQHSLWFTRAWTLQELLAPELVVFYGQEWQLLGTKSDFADVIAGYRGIPQDVLKYEVNMYALPVAQRMSWARRRSSRRVEDIAYSLLGVFDVNMPLLYGEGDKAFHRLQEEIIKQHNDHTLFLWSSTAQDDGRLLAPSPDSFGPNHFFHFRPSRKGMKPFAVTNIGLSITLPLIPWSAKTYLALLDCEMAGTETTHVWNQPGLYLRRRADSDLFEKVNFQGEGYGFLHNVKNSERQVREIHIALLPANGTRDSRRSATPQRNLNEMWQNRAPELYGFVLRTIEVHEGNRTRDVLLDCNMRRAHRFAHTTRTIQMEPGMAGEAVVVSLPRRPLFPTGVEAIKLGFDFDFRPCCYVGVVRNDTMYTLPSQRLDNPSASSEAILDQIDMSKDQDYPDLRNYVVPLSEQGSWLLRGDLQLGLSMLLGPPTGINEVEGDFCFHRRQISVRLTREYIKKWTAWVFDLRISPCPGTYCKSHHQDGDEEALSVPHIVVSPPGS